MNADAIPAELRARRQWVVWKHERRNGKWTKVPYRAADGRTKARCDDPRTWGTFEQALACVEVQGIGYVFSAEDPFTGVDLDGCIDVQTGELHPAAGELLEQLGGYQERSPSGAGMHAIVIAELRSDRHATNSTPWGDEFAVYTTGRFFTVTGEGSGELRECQQLDAIVARMLGPNGSRPAAGTAPAGTAQEVLDRHEDLAKIAARKGTKPGDGSGHAWDFMLGCRAAEHGYGDDVLAALIRHARKLHGEEKGERDDYIERTTAAVRRRVGYVGADATLDAILAELTKALRVDELGRRVASTRVAGHGNTAAVTIVLDDGYKIRFSNFEHVAQPGKLADQLSTTVGIATDFSKLQSRRIARLVRLAADRRGELHEHAQYADEAARLLKLAHTIDFEFANQAEKWRVWEQLDAIDPEEFPDSKAAETYAKHLLIPADRTTGVRFVHAGWLQHFMRLRLGASSTPQHARQAMLDEGWRVRGRDGRIKATEPGGSGRELTLVFYLVPRDWLERQGDEVQ